MKLINEFGDRIEIREDTISHTTVSILAVKNIEEKHLSKGWFTNKRLAKRWIEEFRGKCEWNEVYEEEKL